MTASNLRKRETADVPQGRRRLTRAIRGLGGRLPGARARPRSRGLEVAGVLIGLAIGLVLALAARPYVARSSAGTGADPPASLPASLPPSAGTALVPRASIGPVPTALDAEWAAYSDRATCADWAGGDGISAVRLSSSQIAWFFSDSYLGPASPSSGFSHSTGLVHNSVVIQTLSGHGGEFATLTGGGVCSSTVRPAAVVGPPQAPGGRSTRYWDEDGIKIGDTIVKFYNSYRLGNAPYVPTGTVLATFPVGELSSAGGASVGGVIAAPQLIPLPSYAPPGNDSPIVWGAAVLRAGNTVYVYGTQTPDTLVPDRQLYLARVPASQLTEFAAWQFYAGAGRWTASQPAARPLQPAESSLSVSSGFSVVQAGQRYWLIQANPIAGNQDIDAYPGDAPWGPFDQAAGIVLYRDPGMGLDAAHDFRLMYEARVEPAVSTSHALVINYNVNSIGITAGCIPMSWFSNTVTLPRFITVPLTMLSAARGGAAVTGAAVTGAAVTGAAVTGAAVTGAEGGVAAGPPDYPRVAQQDPSQWFDEWNYPNGCPPVPGVSGAHARARPGAVTLSWPYAGLGVAYRVYVRPPGAAGYVLKTTVSFVLSTTARTISTTLTGLPAGKYTARVVPLNLRQQAGHLAQVTFTVPGG